MTAAKFRRRTFPALLAVLAAAGADGTLPPSSPAQTSEPPLLLATPADAAVASPASLASLSALVNTLVRENLPAEFESSDNWGHTTEIWNGLDVRREGLQIKTKRRKKQVNDGTWKRYRVRLIEPDKQLHVALQNVRSLPGGRVEFELAAEARLQIFARLSQWELGVQLFSLSVNAEAQTRLWVRSEVGLKLDPTKLPPDVILDPAVRQAEVQLIDFRLDRISQVGGSVARELGEQARHLLDKELAHQNRKLPDKINRQIDKNRDRLRLSVQDLLTTQWGPLVSKQLGLGERQE